MDERKKSIYKRFIVTNSKSRIERSSSSFMKKKKFGWLVGLVCWSDVLGLELLRAKGSGLGASAAQARSLSLRLSHYILGREGDFDGFRLSI